MGNAEVQNLICYSSDDTTSYAIYRIRNSGMACSFGATFAASLMSKLIDSSLLGYHAIACICVSFPLA